MIRQVRIKNFKSIPDLTLDLGRVTVLIGANGSGKSNILEAIGFLAAAAENKLDNEFMSARGIRMADPKFMRSAFLDSDASAVDVSVSGDHSVAFRCAFRVSSGKSFPKWEAENLFGNEDRAKLAEFFARGGGFTEAWKLFVDEIAGALPGFRIFAPESSELRKFQSESQILPLGIKGEGIFSHLKALDSEKRRSVIQEVKDRLNLIEWFETFSLHEDNRFGERAIHIRDRYLPKQIEFDQHSANEGFLFLLFYLTLFASPETPKFFAIDNIDSALNPKLCNALLKQLVELAKKYDKQVILTTHNAAVLDGLDLKDDEQRLMIVERTSDGHTRVRRVEAPKPVTGVPPVSLSEAFMRGYFGGLPTNF